jgi:hypothetical protein
LAAASSTIAIWIAATVSAMAQLYGTGNLTRAW